jgi:hypothetical protein
VKGEKKWRMMEGSKWGGEGRGMKEEELKRTHPPTNSKKFLKENDEGELRE